MRKLGVTAAEPSAEASFARRPAPALGRCRAHVSLSHCTTWRARYEDGI